MLKIKRMALSLMAVLAAIGVTSPASATPIIEVTYNYSAEGTTAAGNSIFDIWFKIGLFCPAFAATCSATGNTLEEVFLELSVDDVNDADPVEAGIQNVQTDVNTVDSIGETLFSSDPIAAPFFIDGEVGFATVDGLVPNDFFNLAITTVMVGGFDPILGFDTFLGTTDWFFEFFGDGWELSYFDFSEVYAELDLSLVNAFTVVPEPGTLVLFAIGLLGIGAARRRKINSG